MNKPIEPLEEGKIYHIYNCGNNGDNIFFEEKNYTYFLNKYAKHVAPFVDTFAYCLLKNHFHFLIRPKNRNEIVFDLLSQKSEFKNLKDFSEIENQKNIDNNRGLHSTEHFISKKFSDLFNGYSKGMNKVYGRTGSLFENPFHRKLINHDKYLTTMVRYIHNNPVKHGFVTDISEYPHSSFHSLISSLPSKLAREETLAWFGKNNFIKLHSEIPKFKIDDFIIENI